MSSKLSYNQQTEILEHIYDLLNNADPDVEDLNDIIMETVDGWMPVYYNQILKEWQLAGCPEPEEIMTLADADNIFHAMQVGLWETGHDFLASFLSAAKGIRYAIAVVEEEIEGRK